MQVTSTIQENILLRHPPVSCASSSQEGLSDLTSNPALRGKVSSSADGIDISKSPNLCICFPEGRAGFSDNFKS